jgi:hypothetical protein
VSLVGDSLQHMDEMADKLRSLFAWVLNDVAEPESPNDPPAFPELGEVRETEDGLAVTVGDAEYRVRIERA